MDTAPTVKDAYQLIKDGNVTFHFLTHENFFKQNENEQRDNESGEFIKHAIGIKVKEGARIETGMLQTPYKEAAYGKRCKESIAEKDGWWTFDLIFRNNPRRLVVRSIRFQFLRARFTEDEKLILKRELPTDNEYVQQLKTLLKEVGR